MKVIIMIAKSLNKKSSHCINKRKKCFLFHICVNYLPHGSFEAVLLISMVQKKRGKDEDLYPSLFSTHLPHSLSLPFHFLPQQHQLPVQKLPIRRFPVTDKEEGFRLWRKEN